MGGRGSVDERMRSAYMKDSCVGVIGRCSERYEIYPHTEAACPHEEVLHRADALWSERGDGKKKMT